MKHVNLLDCTLRDGGYLVDAEFGDTAIKGIIKGLTDANLDVIECGFLKDEPHHRGNTVFNNAAQIREYLPEDRKQASYVCLSDFSRYSIENLDEYDGTSIDGVRACFFKKERYDVIDFCKEIKRKGYKLYVQPVDILGYTDEEIIELIHMINPIEPYAFSIVDTFGSMFTEDLQRIFYLVHHNLTMSSQIGFHSHNNLQMSFALSQEFIQLTQGLRHITVDATLCGMGRGAGNTNTELLLQYMNRKFNTGYDIDVALDVIDNYIDSIRATCEWGYSIPYYLAGSYSAHVNNIAYLTNKAGICSRDINYILNKLGAVKRKRYDYDLLEKIYVEYVGAMTDDTASIAELTERFSGKDVLLLFPGKTTQTYQDKINAYIDKKKPVVISINLLNEDYPTDFVWFANKQRYRYWQNDPAYGKYTKIITSNITSEAKDNEIVVDFTKLVKCGWEQLDNSGILLLRLLDELGVNSIAMAGFDGYSHAQNSNYAKKTMEKTTNTENAEEANQCVLSMLEEYENTRQSECDCFFITPSRFDKIFRYQED